MKAILIVILFYLTGPITVAQSLDWGAKIGDSGSDIGNAHFIDSQGNIYLVGLFSGTVDMDPGVGVAALTSVGLNDMFISKISGSGSLIWTQQYGENGMVFPLDITLDSSGNIYVSGSFQDTADFDPGSGQALLMAYATGSGFPDAFICKFDASGGIIWARGFGGMSLDWGTKLEIDGSGNVITCGRFAAGVDFDPGPGTHNISVFGEAFFIHKMDASGNFIWVKTFSQQGIIDAFGMGIDASGAIYCAGEFEGPIDFDPGPGSYILTAPGIPYDYDVFVCKLTPAGDFAWAKQMGSDSIDRVTGVGFDLFGNVYTTGYFEGISDFNPDSSSVYNLTPAVPGGMSNFFCKLDSAGDFQWASQFEGFAGHKIVTGINNNIYLCGITITGVDVDPGPGVYIVNTYGPCFAAFSQAGTFQSAFATNGGGADLKGVTFHQNGSLYVSGHFSGSLDLDPGPANVFLYAANTDAYVWKLNGVTGEVDLQSNTSVNYFPNPAREFLTLQYHLEEDSHVTIELTDIARKLVFAHDNGIKRQAGYQSEFITFPDNIPAGTYLVSLKIKVFNGNYIAYKQISADKIIFY